MAQCTSFPRPERDGGGDTFDEHKAGSVMVVEDSQDVNAKDQKRKPG